MQLLEQRGDFLDRLLAFVVGMGADTHCKGHQHEWRGDGQGSCSCCRNPGSGGRASRSPGGRRFPGDRYEGGLRGDLRGAHQRTANSSRSCLRCHWLDESATDLCGDLAGNDHAVEGFAAGTDAYCGCSF